MSLFVCGTTKTNSIRQTKLNESRARLVQTVYPNQTKTNFTKPNLLNNKFKINSFKSQISKPFWVKSL